MPIARDRSPDRRNVLKGFAMGSVVSAAMAASVVLFVRSGEQDQRILGEVVSAHLRSLQADHLTDVQSTDQHTVKPWFNGRLDVAPPVVDLTAVGFTLLGGRLDYVAGRAVAAIAYRRRVHVINLFVTPDFGRGLGAERATKMETLQGFNIRRWTSSGLNFWAVSDISADELQEFGTKFEEAAATNGS
jgi:anti-sigma factor RsiW